MKKEYKTSAKIRRTALDWYYDNKKSVRAKDNAYRADPKNREEIKEKDRLQRAKPSNLEYQRNYRKRYRVKYPKKIIARQRANDIKIPKNFKCDCGKPATDRHHEDYNKPMEVILCCKDCHKILDKNKANI